MSDQSVSFCFPKWVRIRTRHQFSRIAQRASRHVGRWILIESRQSNGSLTRLGITASKRFGKAIQRNRFKRIVREAFRLCRHQLRAGLDINVKPRNDAKNAKSADILGELVGFLGTTVLS